MKVLKYINFHNLHNLLIVSLFYPIKKELNNFKLYNNNINNNFIKYQSIKNIKKSFFQNNMYFDFYNDFCDFNSCCNIERCDIINNKSKKIYKKYNSLTAEHICPQSYIKQFKNANLDMHNIYLTSSIINSHRSNFKYIDEIFYNKLFYNKNLLFNKVNKYNFKNNDYKLYIPCKNIRGPISRTVAYMKYTYPNFDIEKVLDIELLIQWNLMYPPSEMEIYRNNKIKELQGNDNPFISNYSEIIYYIQKYNYL